MTTVFFSAAPLVVTVHGPGRVHLFSYSSNAGMPGHIGAVETTNPDKTRFIISHSYSFEKYAFYWEGAGEAVWSVGSSLQRQPVGRSWNDARVVVWGSPAVTAENISGILPGNTVQRDNQITCFIVPDLI